MGELSLYVQPALSKAEREKQKEKDKIKFKNSKKRCNLYVKNFPPTTTKEQLEELFSKHGPIESCKVCPKEGEALYALICYKNPDSASKAKSDLNQYPMSGKQLIVNYYEIKEQRKMAHEEMMDKNDYQNYIKQNTSINPEMINKPEFIAILNYIIQLLQPKLNHHQGGFNKRPYNNNRGPRPTGPPNNNMGQQRGPIQGMPQAHPGMPGMMPGMQGPNMQGMPGMMPGMQGQPKTQGMPGMPGMMPPQMMQPGMMMPQQLSPLAQQYIQKAYHILPAAVPQNPNYKSQVGETIYEFVEKIAGEDKAPKITGMLIDLPLEEIQGYLRDFGKLEEKVKEASILLN